jgi:hypothetical protein
VTRRPRGSASSAVSATGATAAGSVVVL